MNMSDAYTRCEELGIDTATPDALGRLWERLTPAERPEIFPFARNYESPTFVHPPIGAGPGGYVLTEPAAGQWRMWNGTSTLVFRVGAARARGEWKIFYTTGNEAFSTTRELHEASHEVMAPRPAADAPYVPESLRVPPAPALPVRRRPSTSAQSAARARVLAYEHIRRARIRFDQGVPPTGRAWRPGDTPRLAVFADASTTLARLCAVYLGGQEASPRNGEEARAYALAFALVEASARRLAHRRIR